MAVYVKAQLFIEVIVECPYCNFHDDVSGDCFNHFDKSFSDEDVNHECSECGENFVIHSIV